MFNNSAGMTGIETILNEWSENRKSELIDTYKSMGLKASGAFEKGLKTETRSGNTKIWTAPHTWYMVNGRNPNLKQDDASLKKWVGWAGSTFLKKWVDDKNLNISPFAVAWKIAKNDPEKGWGGIKVPNPHNDGKLISSVLNQSSFDLLIKEIGIYEIKEIKSEIVKAWQQ